MMPAKGFERRSARAILRYAIVGVRAEGVAALWFKVLGEAIYRRVIVIERLLEEPIPDIA
jgi:hypothetical protein